MNPETLPEIRDLKPLPTAALQHGWSWEYIALGALLLVAAFAFWRFRSSHRPIDETHAAPWTVAEAKIDKIHMRKPNSPEATRQFVDATTDALRQCIEEATGESLSAFRSETRTPDANRAVLHDALDAYFSTVDQLRFSSNPELADEEPVKQLALRVLRGMSRGTQS